MDGEFKQFPFGGDFQLQLKGTHYEDLEPSNSGPDETGDISSIGEPEQKTRKRKIDKDGFVTPATPDIPKSSSYYEESSHDDQHSANYDTGSGIPVEDENPSAFCPATDNAETNAGANPNDFGSEQQDGIFPSEPIKLEERESNISANAGSVQDLIKEFGLEAKFLHTQWSETFKESEDFEMLCPNRLDNYIDEAKTLETTLNRQKDVLFRRLQGLGKTLQL